MLCCRWTGPLDERGRAAAIGSKLSLWSAGDEGCAERRPLSRVCFFSPWWCPVCGPAVKKASATQLPVPPREASGVSAGVYRPLPYASSAPAPGTPALSSQGCGCGHHAPASALCRCTASLSLQRGRGARPAPPAQRAFPATSEGRSCHGGASLTGLLCGLCLSPRQRPRPTLRPHGATLKRRLRHSLA